MNRRALLRFALLLPLLGAPAAAFAAPAGYILTPQDVTELEQVQAYLNSIHTLKAHFLQVAPDGAMSQGTVWMDRPGRMRFEYNPPAPYLLVAGGGVLSFEDKSIQQVSQAPLSMTPLGMLLSDHIRFSGPVLVTGMQHLPGQLQVTVVRSSAPYDGSLTLLFTENPLSLRQWTVRDAQNRVTTVTLYNIEQGINLNPDLFQFKDPRSFQNGGNGGGG
ncbi:MAG TPA: outer membrane lipoprotein carrier protein LolA [Acetobacteraceae bacterium]|nr:outer membrane lipoprotein carrier protein LolA [Acetobacteraceae bacterium]